MPLIIRYGEISLKKGKRREFENKLVENLRMKIKRKGYEGKIIRKHGRIIVEGNVPPEIVAKTPGVVSVSPADIVKEDEIEEYIGEKFRDLSPKSFRITVQRIDKRYPKTSMEIAREIGDFFVKKFGWKVNLSNPDLEIFIEVIDRELYFFTEKIEGVGGLPVGTQGKLLSLISGGMDSPVATFLMMRRGAEITALHFSQGYEDDVRKIVNILSDIHPVEFIVENHNELLSPYISNLRRKEWICVICKYLMLKRAGEIAREIGALGIVMGDSLGQVASQTLENLYIESTATDLPIYRPLIGLDKVEIERYARKIGTYDLMVPCMCSFAPKRVITRGKMEEFLEVAKHIGLLE